VHEYFISVTCPYHRNFLGAQNVSFLSKQKLQRFVITLLRRFFLKFLQIAVNQRETSSAIGRAVSCSFSHKHIYADVFAFLYFYINIESYSLWERFRCIFYYISTFINVHLIYVKLSLKSVC
jgi:hypothetical protein